MAKSGKVLYNCSQSLTSTEQAQARTNIGAGSNTAINSLVSDLSSLTSRVNTTEQNIGTLTDYVNNTVYPQTTAAYGIATDAQSIASTKMAGTIDVSSSNTGVSISTLHIDEASNAARPLTYNGTDMGANLIVTPSNGFGYVLCSGSDGTMSWGRAYRGGMMGHYMPAMWSSPTDVTYASLFSPTLPPRSTVTYTIGTCLIGTSDTPCDIRFRLYNNTSSAVVNDTLVGHLFGTGEEEYIQFGTLTLMYANDSASAVYLTAQLYNTVAFNGSAGVYDAYDKSTNICVQYMVSL